MVYSHTQHGSLIHSCVVCFVWYTYIHTYCRYRAALQAKKERTSKAAAGFGAKVKQFTNPKEVVYHCVCVHVCVCVCVYCEDYST